MSEADVKSAIRRVAKTIEQYYENFLIGANECQTRYALIDPILGSLAWDTQDIRQVKVEYDTDWGRVDYALLQSPDGAPSIIVEAKSLSKPLGASAHRQLQGYAEENKKGYAVLSNGNSWMIYDLSRRGKFKNKLVGDIALATGPVAANARTLNQLLRRNLHWGKV